MSEWRVIVQARTSSNRLPGKCLLPVAGFPAAVLAALRASHPEWKSVLATSTDPTDDRLAHLGRAFGLTVVRGPLDDVLGRFVLASEGLPDDAIVARLTADNLFPDALLVREAVDEFVRKGLQYLITWTPTSDVPHGLTVEVFRAGALREAAARATLAPDREHVTPWIRRAFGVALFRPPGLPQGAARLRCTIDTLDDYLRVAQAFEGVSDPVHVPWAELCARLEQAPDTPRYILPAKMHLGTVHSELVLGTARLGRESPSSGARPTSPGPSPDSAANRLVRAALRHRVTHIDTARAYGASERRIGAALERARASGIHIVTRLAPLDSVGDDAPPSLLASLVDASVFQACRDLRRFTLPTLLVHRARDRVRWKGVVWKRLLELRDQGVIDALGVSAATPEEALDALGDPDVRHLQIPFNILDGRWKKAGVDIAARRRPDVTVHGCSPFVRGLLATPERSHRPGPARRRPGRPTPAAPRPPGVDLDAIRMKLTRLAQRLERANTLDLCIAYARSHEWLHGVVVELETAEELEEVVRLFNQPKLDHAAIEHLDTQLEAERDRVHAALLGPEF